MDQRHNLPSVDRLLSHPLLEPFLDRWSRRIVVALVREEIARARERIRRQGAVVEAGTLAESCARRLQALDEPRPRRVINATGVVIHTNLGRAPLSPAAVEAVGLVAGHYSDLEYDLDKGCRGYRSSHLAQWLGLMFPGRATLVVNNNAAAVLLVLNTLALGREVVISRGELIEIGGSFRIPEIMARSGAELVEVGTTNRTHPADYRAALGERTGILLKVWPSNYRIVGFTRTVPLAELAAIGREREIPVVADQGCGRLFRDGPGPASEPAVEDLLAQGADLVCFSGDKIFGGPQAGIILGREDLVEECAGNPLARALRPDKMTLAALTATCRGWMARQGPREVPVPSMLEATAPQLKRRAQALARGLRPRLGEDRLALEPGVSRAGGGSAPEEDLPTWLVMVDPAPLSESELLERLRGWDPPIVARTIDGRVALDPRTLLPGEAKVVIEALSAC